MLRHLASITAERALAAGFFGSGLLLGGAHIFEAAGYAPCDLCLDQREVHWAALGVSAAGLSAAFVFHSRIGAIAALCVAALAYMFSAGLAGYHAGVEYGFWPGPATCSGVGSLDIDLQSIQEALRGPAAGPACDEAPWTLFGVSMAGYNMLFSMGLAGIAAAAGRAAIIDERRKAQA
ncbi:MAG: disulfide bond formation protein B [Pseudomonadota bacterium]